MKHHVPHSGCTKGTGHGTGLTMPVPLGQMLARRKHNLRRRMGLGHPRQPGARNGKRPLRFRTDEKAAAYRDCLSANRAFLADHGLDWEMQLGARPSRPYVEKSEANVAAEGTPLLAEIRGAGRKARRKYESLCATTTASPGTRRKWLRAVEAIEAEQRRA